MSVFTETSLRSIVHVRMFSWSKGKLRNGDNDGDENLFIMETSELEHRVQNYACREIKMEENHKITEKESCNWDTAKRR